MMQQLKGMMQQVQMAQNPQLALNQLLMNNPQLKQAIDFIKENGNDPQTAFFNLARQKGIDPQAILSQLR